MKRKNDHTLGEALNNLVDAFGMREKLDEQEVASIWDELVGGMVAKHTVAVKLRRGRLYIKVDSAPLRQELTYLRATLVQRINEKLGRAVVDEIRLD